MVKIMYHNSLYKYWAYNIPHNPPIITSCQFILCPDNYGQQLNSQNISGFGENIVKFRNSEILQVVRNF